MTSTHLGVTAHFFSRKDHRQTLAVQVFPCPHTADRVGSLLDEILKERNNIESKLYNLITDIGSNVVKAFRNDAIIYNTHSVEDGSVDKQVQMKRVITMKWMRRGISVQRSCSITLHLHILGSGLAASLTAFSLSFKGLKINRFNPS